MKRAEICIPILLVLLVATVPSTIHTYVRSEPSDLAQAGTEIIAFSSNVLLSTDDSSYPHHVEVTMTLGESGQIFVGWKNSETHNGGGASVSWVMSADGGHSWSAPSEMSNFGGGDTRQSDPWMRWHNGVLYYAYLEYGTDPEFSQITVARSDNSGATWSMVPASFGDYFADKETMTISDNGTIYVVYDDVDTSENGNTTVKLSRSTDGGKTFFDMSEVSDDPDSGHVGPYAVVGADGVLYVAWSHFTDDNGNILFDSSDDGGLSFGKDRIVNTDGNYSKFVIVDNHPSRVTLPVLRFDPHGRLYLLWADTYPDSEAFDVYLRYSDDNGLTWSDRVRINNRTSGDQWNPEMDIDPQGNLHIAYYSEEGAYYRPYYRMVSFEGTDRSTPFLGNEVPIASERTSNVFSRPGEYLGIRVDSNNRVHVAWADGRNSEMDVFYAYGLTATPTSTVTTSTNGETTNGTDIFWTQERILAFVLVLSIATILVVRIVITVIRRSKTE